MTVTIPVGSVAQRVMELAVDQNTSYKFSATYYGTKLGYLIDTINGISSGKPLSWSFYYKSPGKHPVKASEGVTHFIIPEDGGTVIFRYEKDDN